MYTHVRVCTHTLVYTYIHTYTHANAHDTSVDVVKRERIQTPFSPIRCTFFQDECTRACPRARAHQHPASACSTDTHIHIRTCTHTQIHTRTYAYIDIYAHTQSDPDRSTVASHLRTCSHTSSSLVVFSLCDRMIGTHTTCVGASNGGSTKPVSSLCVIMIAPINRVVAPQLVAHTG